MLAKSVSCECCQVGALAHATEPALVADLLAERRRVPSEVTSIQVFRGRPNPKHEPRPARANDAQRQQGERRDERVTARLRRPGGGSGPGTTVLSCAEGAYQANTGTWRKQVIPGEAEYALAPESGRHGTIRDRA